MSRNGGKHVGKDLFGLLLEKQVLAFLAALSLTSAWTFTFAFASYLIPSTSCQPPATLAFSFASASRLCIPFWFGGLLLLTLIAIIIISCSICHHDLTCVQ